MYARPHEKVWGGYRRADYFGQPAAGFFLASDFLIAACDFP